MKNTSRLHGTFRKRGRPAARRGKRWARMACGCPIVVDTDQRLHLIESCAFFQAGRFREVGPGPFRKQDLERAATEIDAVLRRHGIAGPVRGARRSPGPKRK